MDHRHNRTNQRRAKVSFARFGWEGSDVYVFEHAGGFIQCCGCGITEPEEEDSMWGFANLKTPKEALAHLEEHKKVGDNVESAINGITDGYSDLDVTIEPYLQSEGQKERAQKLWDNIVKRSSDD